MATVKQVVVNNRSDRAYSIGGVEILPGGWGRVDADDEFLSTLRERGSVTVYDDKKAQTAEDPMIAEAPEEPEQVEATPRKTTRRSSKGDED